MNQRLSATIRAFRSEDVGIVKQLIDATIDASYTGVYPPHALQFFKEYHAVQRILEDASNGHTVVLQSEGAIVGTGTLLGREIRRMFVSPGCQRRGFGHRVLAALEHRATANRLDDLELYSSLVARPFYDAMGFRVLREGFIPLDDGQRLDYFLMGKSLAARADG